MRFLVFQALLLFPSFLFAQITDQTLITKVDGKLGNGISHCAAMSGDARYTIFESDASNLVLNDSNSRVDLLLYDSQTAGLRRLSQRLTGEQQSGGDDPVTCNSAISRDGSTVFYATSSIGLVDSLQTNVSRLYSINVDSGEIELLTSGPLTSGVYFPSVSGDAKRVVFMSDDTSLSPSANGIFQLYMLERPSNTLTMLSVGEAGEAGNGASSRAEISQDGKWVVYTSTAHNLKGASISEVNENFQAFLLNIETGVHTLISKSPDGALGNGFSLGVDISADGSKAIFSTEADNLSGGEKDKEGNLYLYNRDQPGLEVLGLDSQGKRLKGFHEILGSAISADGNLVMFRALVGSRDKFRIEVYVRDRANSRTYLGSFSSSCSFGDRGGDSHSGALAPDATRVAFAIGKGTERLPLQITLVGLDVLRTISSAPDTLDLIDADVCKDSALLAMTPFNADFSQAALRAGAQGVTYETKLKREGRNSSTKQLQSKKNLIALSNLTPGNYSASYRVKLTSPAGTTRSNYSKATKFSIK